MKDAGQKDLLYRHFRAQGWYATVEVPVYHRGGVHGKRKLITDVDVLALRPGADLRWEVVIADCKTKRGESPANRALWARSLLDHFSAARGIVLLKRDKAGIEPDHKLFADSLGITLLDQGEFGAYDRASNYPTGSSDFPEGVGDLKAVREDVVTRFPKLAVLSEYASSLAWNEPSYFDIMRKSIAAGRSVHKEIDPAKGEHVALILESAGVFGIGFAHCVGAVFRQYVQPEEQTELSDALKVLIWGGRQQYDYIATLRRRILEAKGGSDPEGDLALPEWDTFIHVVRSFLDGPRFAFQVAQVLRAGAVDLVRGRQFLGSYGSDDAMLLKLSMLVATYYAQACLHPVDLKTEIRDLFIRRISEVASSEFESRSNKTADRRGEGAKVLEDFQAEIPYSGRTDTG